MTLPPWGMDGGGLALVLARDVWLVGLLSSAGALFYRAREPAVPPALGNRILRLILASLSGALLGWLAWSWLQAAALAGDGAPAAVPAALGDSAFGRVAMAQLGLLGAAALALRWGRWPPAALALAAVALQALHLHGWAMERGAGVLSASGVVHLLAAAIWLGGLPPLRIVVRHSAPALAAAASRRFSPGATLCVLALASTALLQGITLFGGWPGVVGTAYGWVATGKLLLFACLLAYAARHRFRLTPALASPEPAATHRALVASIGREAAVGVLVVLAAGLLSGLQPGMHLQPVWPFPLQPSLVTVREDAEFVREAAGGIAGLIVAAGLAALALLHRRARWPLLRWPVLVAAVALAWFTVPHLRPLLVEANPTSFYRSPTGFAATGIVEGEGLYGAHCGRCHGADGAGSGPDAAALPVPPADLTAEHLWMHSDGELFWWLSHGIEAPAGGLAMPGFAASLDEDQRWRLIDFIRARNAGLAHAATARWPMPLPAPDIVADCAGGRSVTLDELRGRRIRLAFQAMPGAPPMATPPMAGVTTIFVPLPDQPEASGGDCIASDPSVPLAYAIVTGLSPRELAGASVLIDSAGLLRDVLRPGPPAALDAALRRLVVPLPDGAAAAMHHHS